ncbi:EamA family transporter [Marinomonas pollencensis]|uniref:DME family drug/metabolite transporter/O-acetylserine/cysteine efflux transporter n=1 Tax=Marinomonas pollencensis TaxID=491954 RepID=A0A3E0DBT0_9GAMM|nr:EamA family transporter [Marinomonas pollencensis]REG79351.1 DME family drug/metabolite transporter/O-acetylserine/cysteine efflux transporter [Marinomonas pollencensis]
MTPRDLLIALTIIIAWGLNFVVIRWGLDDLPPMMLGGLRFLMVAVIGSLFFKRPKTPLKWWFLYALPLSFGQFAFLFSAMEFGMPAGLASLVLQSQAIFTLLFAVVFLKESVRPYQVIAIAIAAGGLATIALENDNSSMTLIGFGLTLVAATCWALGNISTKVISKKGYHANVNLVIWSCWIPPLPFFICSWFIDGPDAMEQSLYAINWGTMATLAYLSVFATVAGYGLWSYLMSRYPAATIAPLTLGVPVVGLTSSAILLSEYISPMQWVGILVVLLGLILNTLGGRLLARKRKAQEVL